MDSAVDRSLSLSHPLIDPGLPTPLPSPHTDAHLLSIQQHNLAAHKQLLGLGPAPGDAGDPSLVPIKAEPGLFAPGDLAGAGLGGPGVAGLDLAGVRDVGGVGSLAMRISHSRSAGAAQLQQLQAHASLVQQIEQQQQQLEMHKIQQGQIDASAAAGKPLLQPHHLVMNSLAQETALLPQLTTLPPLSHPHVPHSLPSCRPEGLLGMETFDQTVPPSLQSRLNAARAAEQVENGVLRDVGLGRMPGHGIGTSKELNASSAIGSLEPGVMDSAVYGGDALESALQGLCPNKRRKLDSGRENSEISDMRTFSKLLDRGVTGSGDGVQLDSPDLAHLLDVDERT